MKARTCPSLGIFVMAAATTLLSIHPQAIAYARSTAPTEGALFGAWVKQRNTDTHYESVVAFEQLIGRKLAISHHYRSWDNNYWGEEALDVAAGRYPLVTWGDWGKTPARDIAAGRHDGLIRGKADAIRALGGTVMVRWAPEMAGGSYGTASEYISAWRHIHGIFRDRGATNVEWVWCPTAFSFRNGTAPAFYPGDAYVDWICADGYNWYPAQGEWKTFADIFRWFYEWGSQRDKPLMIGETGVMEDPAMPGRKAGWFDQVVPALKAMPKVKAFVYFHARSPKGYEFWADTSSGALTAFKRMASDAYLDGEGAPPEVPDSSARCTIAGTEGPDMIVGTPRSDVICANGGADTIDGGGGDDVILGGQGADIIGGGDGNDVLNGGADSDTLRGGAGTDTLYGVYGDDLEHGGSGNDFLGGGDGNDRQDGGSGADVCDQGSGTGTQTSCEG